MLPNKVDIDKAQRRLLLVDILHCKHQCISTTKKPVFSNNAVLFGPSPPFPNPPLLTFALVSVHAVLIIKIAHDWLIVCDASNLYVTFCTVLTALRNAVLGRYK